LNTPAAETPVESPEGAVCADDYRIACVASRLVAKASTAELYAVVNPPFTGPENVAAYRALIGIPVTRLAINAFLLIGEIPAIHGVAAYGAFLGLQPARVA